MVIWRNDVPGQQADVESRQTTCGSRGKQPGRAGESGVRDLYAMLVDGGEPLLIGHGTGGDIYHPTWSPDGSQISFHSYQDGNSEIYIMDVDDSSQTRITNNPASDFSPAWSPNI